LYLISPEYCIRGPVNKRSLNKKLNKKYQLSSDHWNQAARLGTVNTWMGDRLRTPFNVTLFFVLLSLQRAIKYKYLLINFY